MDSLRDYCFTTKFDNDAGICHSLYIHKWKLVDMEDMFPFVFPFSKLLRIKAKANFQTYIKKNNDSNISPLGYVFVDDVPSLLKSISAEDSELKTAVDHFLQSHLLKSLKHTVNSLWCQKHEWLIMDLEDKIESLKTQKNKRLFAM